MVVGFFWGGISRQKCRCQEGWIVCTRIVFYFYCSINVQVCNPLMCYLYIEVRLKFTEDKKRKENKKQKMKENVNDNVNIFSYFQVELHIYLNNNVFGVKGQLVYNYLSGYYTRIYRTLTGDNGHREGINMVLVLFTLTGNKVGGCKRIFFIL